MWQSNEKDETAEQLPTKLCKPSHQLETTAAFQEKRLKKSFEWRSDSREVQSVLTGYIISCRCQK